MKKNFIRCIFLVFILLGINVEKGWGQLVAWDFNGKVGNEPTVNATTNNSNMATSSISRGSGIVASSLSNSFNSEHFSITANSATSAIAEGDFLIFSVKANNGYRLSLSTLDANFRRSNTGPSNFLWQYSKDGNLYYNIGVVIASTSTTTNGVAQPQIDLTSISDLQNVPYTTTITFRLVAWGATNTAGSFAIGRLSGNDLAINGTICQMPTATFSPASQTICGGNGAYSNINLNVTGNGTVNVSYEVTTASGTQTKNVSLSQGTYPSAAIFETTTHRILSVSDNNCSGISGSTATVTVHPEVKATFSPSSQTVCIGSSASVDINLSGGGTYSFTYTVSDGNTTTSTDVKNYTGSRYSIPVPTNTENTFTYGITSIKDNNGCSGQTGSSSIAYVVNKPTAIFSPSTQSVCGTGPGIWANVDLILTGTGDINVSYEVTTASGKTTSNVSKPAGTYQSAAIFETTTFKVLSVSDAACTGTAGSIASVTFSDIPTATVSGSKTVCYGSAEPQVTFSGSGGTAPYTFTYKINNGTTQTISTAQNSSTVSVGAPTNQSGTFTYQLLKVEDTYCSQVYGGAATVTVKPQFTINTSAPPILCNGGSTTITVTPAAGGEGNISYRIDHPNGSIVFTNANHPTSATFGNITAGLYTVTAINGNSEGCLATSTLQVNEPSILMGNASQGTIKCYSGATTVTAYSSGGTGIRKYNLSGTVASGGNYSVTSTSQASGGVYSFTHVPEGSYTVKAFDENGCEATIGNFTINQPPVITGNSSAGTIKCNGGTTTVTAYSSGGTGNIVYKLSSTNYSVQSSPQPNGGVYTFTNVSAGNYSVTATDQNECTRQIALLNIGQPLPVGSIIYQSDPTCNGSNNGYINVSTVTGGIHPYYISKDGGLSYQPYTTTGPTFSGLSAGTYPIVIKDVNGCVYPQADITLSDPSIIAMGRPAVQHVSTAGGRNGAITVRAGGGGGSYIYTLQNPDNSSTQLSGSTSSVTFNGLPGGTYTITATDNGGCTTVGVRVIIEQPAAAPLPPDLLLQLSGLSSVLFPVPFTSVQISYDIFNISASNAQGVSLRVQKPTPGYAFTTIDPNWSMVDNGSSVDFILTGNGGQLNSGFSSRRLTITVTRGSLNNSPRGSASISANVRSSVPDANNRNNNQVLIMEAL